MMVPSLFTKCVRMSDAAPSLCQMRPTYQMLPCPFVRCIPRIAKCVPLIVPALFARCVP